MNLKRKTQNWASNLNWLCVKNVRDVKNKKSNLELLNHNQWNILAKSVTTVLAYLQNSSKYRALLNAISFTLYIYIQFMKRDCLSSWKSSDYLCWNSKETLKHLMIFVVSEFKSQITIESKKKQMNEEKMIKTFVGVGVSLVFTFAIQSTSFRSFDKKHKTQATYLPQTRKRINVQSQRRQSSSSRWGGRGGK